MVSKKVIIDTNLLVSFLISRKLHQLDTLLQQHQITLIFSNELIEEFVTVAHRPKLRKYFDTDDIDQLLQFFDFYGNIVQVTSSIELCRDKHDNFLLSLAVDAKANFLLTGDKDLLVLSNVQQTKIVTYKEFLESIYT